jgi:hypothetical protein
VIGGFDHLSYRDFAGNGQAIDFPLPANDLFLGYGLDIAEQASADGTYQVWVSGLSDVANESRVWILRGR